jgi:hypothetical protein
LYLVINMSVPAKPRKWIQQRIWSLDPNVGYEEIWRLTSSYGLTGFTQNLVYAITFPNFIVTPRGAEAPGLLPAIRRTFRGVHFTARWV